ncbi:MAG: aldo/keto reductase [Nitriliruptoraceae bacterium]
MSATDLPTVPLGTTGMDITRVGFGAWAIGGGDWHFTWGEQDDRESVAAIRRAVDAGINWIDTAAVYGLGHSEQVVGRALREMPPDQRPYVFTKGGLVGDLSDRNAKPRKIGDPSSLRREVDASLTRLAVERIDLYQMHWPADDDGTPLEDYWGTFLDLRREGKVRAVGLSNHEVHQLEAAERLGHVETLQPLFNLLERDAATDVLPWCADHDTGVIVYSPMASGLLTGAFSRERAESLRAEDWRSRDPAFRGERLTRNLEVADALVEVAARHEVPVPSVAVAWTLAFRGVTGAIVGARRPEQVDGWLPAAHLDLDREDLDVLAATLEATSAGSGPTAP